MQTKKLFLFKYKKKEKRCRTKKLEEKVVQSRAVE